MQWVTFTGSRPASAQSLIDPAATNHVVSREYRTKQPCRAKNYVPGKEGQSTKVAAAVIELQRRLPHARCVYCSATGVSEVGHMAYLERMGLWGPGSAFPDFESFLSAMRNRGVSFLEMLAMEMKAEGKYCARGLSFRSAEFSMLPCALTAPQARPTLCRALCTAEEPVLPRLSPVPSL